MYISCVYNCSRSPRKKVGPCMHAYVMANAHVLCIQFSKWSMRRKEMSMFYVETGTWTFVIVLSYIACTVLSSRIIFFFLLIKFGEIKERKNFHASSLGLNPRLRLKIVKILWPIVLRGLLLFGLSNLIYDYGKYPLFQGIAFENLWNLSFEQWLKEIFFCPSNCCQYILLLYDDNTRRSFLFCCNLTFSWTEQVDLSLN